MWEFCIETSKQNVHLLEVLFQKLILVVKQTCGIQTIVCFKQNCCLVLACKKEHEKKFKQKLLIELSDVICKNMKYDFLKNNLCLEFEKGLEEVFLKVFTYFDIELERNIVLKKLVFKEKLNLESFFNFKLQSLKQKWLEFCNLLKTNATLVEKDVGSQELLKFLILNLNPKFECLILDFNKMRCFQNDFNTKICELKKDKMFLLGVIVENYATKILTVGLKNKELKSFLTEFFDEKVEFC